jgi:selenocysteine-specific elongation factor
VHNQDAERAVAGQRTALNLAGIEARELARGMTLAPPGLFQSSTRLAVAISLLASARPLKNRSRVHFHSWSSEIVAEVVLLGGKELRPGERAYAQLRLAEPGLFLPGDRFIVRQFSPVVTIGGGMILDNDPPAHRADDESAREFLRTMEAGQPAARLERLAERAGEISLSTLVARTGWQPEAVLKLARQLERDERGRLLGQPATLLVDATQFRGLQQRVLEQLDNFHATNPLVTGMTKEHLRGRLARRQSGHVVLPSALLFNAVLQSLAAEGKALLEGETVRRAGRGIELSPEESVAKEQIGRAFEKAELAVPGAAEVLGGLPIDRARAEKILRILLKEKVLVKVTEDLIFHRSALERLREVIARHKQQSNRLNVAVFKELTGLTRKYAIPLLEYLDRERITRRQGDERVIL